ncbi:prolyl 4-hydroxylase subunit alpha-2 [Eurytemora carolleeae]|uniref:prolyl 4-hydroxylase subunit alpha-2 n=1 Tax=Eurytemora carolleeae TaxID=1294199 RepID=UPI000C75DF2F|nr:prolyl 4-hydroxylase subunit alpha-2 [Eurytemora carolleeae]|eukprot:XP_023331149.1 prolyl 4-hydroxylase subunit alpha-2-like [Eurytemora affinis]
MKNVWMNESDSKGLQVLSRRLEAATGLSTDNKEEPFMIGNYGIGGSYGVHPDYHHPESSTDNRIMTTMTVVSSPVQGGTTVWPFLGVSVILQKGDTLIWKNLSNEGDPLVLTHHAACPVLLGDKWIVNKWLSYNEQWNRNKCMRTAVNKSMK